jgi:hypothetical protein
MYIRIDENLSKQPIASSIGHQQINSKIQIGEVIISSIMMPLKAVSKAIKFRIISNVIRQSGTMKSRPLIIILVGQDFDLFILNY